MGKRRFMASVRGDSSTETSRLASRVIDSHTRGWDLGVQVIGRAVGDSDTFEVYATFGSNDPDTVCYLGTVRLDAEGMPTFEKDAS